MLEAACLPWTKRQVDRITRSVELFFTNKTTNPRLYAISICSALYGHVTISLPSYLYMRSLSLKQKRDCLPYIDSLIALTAVVFNASFVFVQI